MDKYEKNYLLILVTNVNSVHRKANIYKRNEILNPDIMEVDYDRILYIVKK